MARIASLGGMVEQLDGLRGTDDLTPWEQEFTESVLERYVNAGRDSTVLSPKQAEVVQKIWNKHFA